MREFTKSDSHNECPQDQYVRGDNGLSDAATVDVLGRGPLPTSTREDRTRIPALWAYRPEPRWRRNRRRPEAPSGPVRR